MAKNQNTFEKLQRERQKKRKADEKRARKREKKEVSDRPAETEAPSVEQDQPSPN